MATVFLAVDTVLNREVAVKMVHPHLLQNPETIKRFSNEARAIAALSHEHIIKIFDSGEDGVRHFMVMEYINGITLEELITRRGTLPNLVTAEIARQALAGLSCMHRSGIFHRDIKPDNILIDREGCIRITDFGIAYLVNKESITMTGSFLGSPRYISPEQISGNNVQGNTDVFSLGVVLFRCLTGTFPFHAETPHGVIHAALHDPVVFPKIKDAPPILWLVDLIESCLIKDPLLRPHADEVARRLEAYCRADAIELGMSRLGRFLNDPTIVSASEIEELFAIYRQRTMTELKTRQIATGLRHLEQTRLFGTITASDQRIIDSSLRRSFFRRVAVTAMVCLPLVAVVCIALALFFQRQQPRQTEGSTTWINNRRIDSSQHHVDRHAPIVKVSRQSLPKSKAPPTTLTKDGAAEASGYAAAPPRQLKAEFQPGTVNVRRGSAFLPESMIGFLSLHTNPPWVTIYIDNIERGKTPSLSTVSLAAGRHPMRLAKEGFLNCYDTVTIKPSDTTSLRIRLLPCKRDSLSP